MSKLNIPVPQCFFRLAHLLDLQSDPLLDLRFDVHVCRVITSLKKKHESQMQPTGENVKHGSHDGILGV